MAALSTALRAVATEKEVLKLTGEVKSKGFSRAAAYIENARAYMFNYMRRWLALGIHCPKASSRAAVNGEKPEDVAEAFGVTRNSVDQVKSRLIDKLREVIEQLESVDEVAS